MRDQSEKSGQKTKFKLSRFRRKAEKTATKVADKSLEHIEENVINRAHKLKHIRLFILEWSLMVAGIIVLALLQSSWFADSYSSRVFSKGGSYIEGSLGQVNSLNPFFASTDSEKTLSRLLFATITTSDYTGHIGLGLAKSVQAEQDGKVWRVTLKDDLTWSDGEPITADDVIFTVKLAQSPKLSTTYSSNFNNVEVSKSEDGAVIFTLPSVYADFAAALVIPVLPEHILAGVDPALLIEHSFSSNPVSSGPFRYNATQISNGESVIYLAPNPYYYNGRPFLDSFAVHTFSSHEDIITALNAGAITATAALSPVDAQEITNSNIYEKQTSISSGIFLFMNTSSEVFKNKSARQAVQKGLDLNSIRESVLGDEPALNYPILSSQISLDSWPALPAHDAEAAKAVLSAYGDAEISLVTLKTGYLPELANKIKENLESLGLKVNVTSYDSSQELMSHAITSRSYDLLLYEVELGGDPDLFAYYHSSQIGTNGMNLSDYNDSVTDSLIIRARSTLDEASRKSTYEAILSRWVENAPAVGICQVKMSYFLNRNVRAFSEDDVLIFPTDRFGDVETWAAVKSSKYKTP